MYFFIRFVPDIETMYRVYVDPSNDLIFNMFILIFIFLTYLIITAFTSISLSSSLVEIMNVSSDFIYMRMISISCILILCSRYYSRKVSEKMDGESYEYDVFLSNSLKGIIVGLIFTGVISIFIVNLRIPSTMESILFLFWLCFTFTAIDLYFNHYYILNRYENT